MIKMIMNTGEEIDLTISHVVLKKVEAEKPDAEKYTKVYYESMSGQGGNDAKETFERAYILTYVGYLCGLAKKDALDTALDYDAFEMALPEDDQLIIMASSALITPNRARDFEAYSKEQRTRSKGR